MIYTFYKRKTFPVSTLRLKFELDIFSISQRVNDLRNIFLYQKNELVLNKILSIKLKWVVK